MPTQSTYYFAWWNVENLFDVEDSPTRPEWLQKKLARELKGWTREVLDQKLDQLAWVIKQMNEGQGPDLLGVCEVENDVVLQQLIDRINIDGRDYQMVHHDMSDNRGIDIAFIYDAKVLKAGAWFSHVVQKRSPTRDILQVGFTTSSGLEFAVLGNHWPSRLGGEADSEPFRMLAGETLAYFHERARHYMGEDTPIIVMGDFNDAPFDKSLTDFALSSHSRNRVLYAQTPRLFNLMWKVTAEGKGSYCYGTEASCLDQILVSKAVLEKDARLSLVDEAAHLVVFPGLAGGRYGAAKKFKPAKVAGGKPAGFSDHLPVGMRFAER